MRRINSRLFLALISACSISGFLYARYQEVFGRAFMYTRPAYEALSLSQAGWHNIVYNKVNPYKTGVRVLPFYQQSIPLSRTTHYFLPNCNTTLLVAGDQAEETYVNHRNIRAEWLGLDNTFVGTFSISPTQKQYGAFFQINQDLGLWTHHEFFSSYWFDVKIPIACVENDLHLTESITTESATYPHTIIQAFNQRDWCYGKLSPRVQTLIRPAEIKLTLGSTLADQDFFQFVYASSFIIPLGNKPNGKQLFGAVIGNNLHAGLGGSIYFQVPLTYKPMWGCWCLFGNLESIFLFRNNQHRTYSLRKKPWSRFLLYNELAPGGRSNIPGVNILTYSSVVKPYGVFDFSTGFRYITDYFEFEFGYNVWGKDGETVYPREPLYPPNVWGKEGLPIYANDLAAYKCNCYGPFGIAGNQPRTTANNSTIAIRADNDPLPIVIRDVDLDFCSAAAGSILNHRVHSALSVTMPYSQVSPCFTLGMYYDIPQKNAAFESWGIWLSLAALL